MRKVHWLILLATATAAALGFAVFLSLNPGNYFFYAHQDRSDWTHPTGHVTFVCGIMLAEAVCTGAILFSPRPARLWARSLLGLSVLLPWALVSSMAVIHMPMYVLFHHLWVWLLVLTVLLALTGSAVKSLYQHSNPASPPEGIDGPSGDASTHP